MADEAYIVFFFMHSWEHDNDLAGSFGHLTSKVLHLSNAEYSTFEWCELVVDDCFIRSTQACGNLIGIQIAETAFDGESTLVTFQPITNAD